MPEYEITLELPNGDWEYWRGEYVDFQAACEAGLPGSVDGCRLIRIELLPPGSIKRWRSDAWRGGGQGNI